uniref:Uncharacterized protein n=1 Tax=Oryza sativa subsp. japonica TaxID=39947 RepID=Q6YZM3_ORYSJ|nr:hypothetical protein [Oryza sativa Japonica Group]
MGGIEGRKVPIGIDGMDGDGDGDGRGWRRPSVERRWGREPQIPHPVAVAD